MSGALPPASSPRLLRVVPALGVAQIITWGSLYYSIAVLSGPMALGLEIPLPQVFGAFSTALVISGLSAPWVGRAIDRHGGRPVLSCGALIAALALALIASAEGPVLFFIGWALAGAAMAATLYDAAFSALSQVAGSRYRQALTALTLFGGFASTVFWPLSWVLEAALGWRLTLGVFALLQLLVCVPLFRLALPSAARVKQTPPPPDRTRPATAATPSGAGVLWLAGAFALGAFVFSAVGAHIVTALHASGLNPETAILAAALIGPMQVAGRILEFSFARHVPARKVGIAAFTTILGSLLLLSFATGTPWAAFGFALCYGIANGVMTIVKGAVPAELFGQAGYGELMGRLARPAFLAKASAPLVVSLMLADGVGYAAMAPSLAGLMALATLSYLAALATLKSRPPTWTLAADEHDAWFKSGNGQEPRDRT